MHQGRPLWLPGSDPAPLYPAWCRAPQPSSWAMLVRPVRAALRPWRSHHAPEGGAAGPRGRRHALRQEPLLPLQAHAPVGEIRAILGPLLGQGHPTHGIEAPHGVAAPLAPLVDVPPQALDLPLAEALHGPGAAGRRAGRRDEARGILVQWLRPDPG